MVAYGAILSGKIARSDRSDFTAMAAMSFSASATLAVLTVQLGVGHVLSFRVTNKDQPPSRLCLHFPREWVPEGGPPEF